VSDESTTPEPQTIIGYNEIDQEQLDTINTVKASEANVAALWKGIAENEYLDTDYDMMRQARDHFTTGYMYLVRAVASSDDPFSFHSNFVPIAGSVTDD
jgi:hypothetical protein